jgi:O-antigen/teichoic acid export membrane protein
MNFALRLAGRSGAARVAINGLIAWARVLGVLVAKLVTTRLLLEAMGIEGYGAYFAAISVALLVGFLTSAMQATSLRAIALDTGDDTAMSRLFSSLLGVHLLVALTIMAIGVTGGLWFVNNVLAIPAELSSAATFSYLCILVAMAFTAFLTPYEAFMQSRERFAIFAFLDVLQAWLLVPVSYYLTLLESGQLRIYAVVAAGMAIVTILVGVSISLRDYPMTRPRPRYFFDATAFRIHSSIFAWTMVGSLSAVGRNQGLAIIVNIVGGPVASAALAVGNQIPAVLRQFAGSLREVLAPRIYGREAYEDRDRMIGLSYTACKISMLTVVALSVPLIVEMPIVLQAWLGNADPVIVFVASVLLVNLVIDESSAGTGLAHMATGRVARYQIVAGGLSLLMLPVAYIIGRAMGDIRDVLLVTIAFTCLVALARVLLLETHMQRATLSWLRDTILRVFAVLLPTLGMALVIEALLPASLNRLALIATSSLALFCIAAYTLALTRFEKKKIRKVLRRGDLAE